MRRRAFLGAGATALASVTAATALLLGTATGHATPGPSEAYGVFITSIIDPPQPYVQSTDGSEVSESLVELPENPLLGLQAATVTAGDSSASVELLGVQLVPGAGLPDELAQLEDALAEVAAGLDPACTEVNAEQLPEQFDPLKEVLPEALLDALDAQQLCAALSGAQMPALVTIDLIRVACDGDDGTFELGKVSLLGQEIELPGPDANTEIPLEIINISFNKQVKDDDGFTVQGAHIEIAGEFEIVLASATCGTAAPDKPVATKPAPITTKLPVTG